MCKTSQMKATVIYLITLFVSSSLFAQITGELQMADEYFKSGQYLKAKILYEELLKDKSKTDFIYNNYLQTLIKLGDFQTAEKFIKKNIKKNDSYPLYKIDHYGLLKTQNKNVEAQKLLDKYAEQLSDKKDYILEAYQILVERNENAFIVSLLTKSRQKLKDVTAFAEQLANAHKQLGNRQEMIHEMINMVKYEADNEELLKDKLQPLLDNDKDLEVLQNILITNIQKDPNDDPSTLLLVWVFIQKKEFDLALTQAKAYDKRNRAGGTQIAELSQIAYENKDYETVISASDYLNASYPQTETALKTYMIAMKAKEEQLKNNYPINLEKVNQLITDYTQICKKSAASPHCFEAQRKQALLWAFYKNNVDTAIFILQKIVSSPYVDQNLKDKAKLDLGDMYVLKDEFWESILLYTQVVKTQKENLLGHEAKFKNAKVYYYKGEFDLAQEQLDVLKLATSREIANDALYLGLIIHMNKSEDSTQNALNIFADADLSKFAMNYDQAEKLYQKLLADYPDDALADDALWNLADIANKKKNYNQSLIYLDQILNKYYADIFADDALYTKAQIYQYKLRDSNKAMELYQKLLTDYPASIFVPDARKNYRKLRGDKL